MAQSTTELIIKTKKIVLEIHDSLRELHISEKHKPIFIAGILLALEDSDFNHNLQTFQTFAEIFAELNLAMRRTLITHKVGQNEIKYAEDFLSFIAQNQKFQSVSLSAPGSIIWHINKIKQEIKPIISNPDYEFDVMGIFYQDFARYSGGDSKSLGIVLTPPHLADFVCAVADVSQSTKVVDLCCGSGAFLVGASSHHARQLFGVELDIELYLLAVTNLIVKHQDASQILYGDCFNPSIKKFLSSQNLDVGLINPPYAQTDYCELEFVDNMLSILKVGGLGVAIVPMSSAIGTKFKDVRKNLMTHHTLKAVFSMPDQIFYPVGVNVCIMIWQAHAPHQTSQPTFFGYYKKDGLVKQKKLGRLDIKNSWSSIKQEWLKLYRNQIARPGLSALQSVTNDDEWLCEAYMQTDYSALTRQDFEKTVRDYVAYLVKNGREPYEA